MAKFVFKLFVIGNNANHLRTCESLKQLCENYLPGAHELEVIDITKNPEIAEEERILATPTLVKVAPGPTQRVLGDLAAGRLVLEVLDIPVKAPGAHEERYSLEERC
jgi:circadian clock protein KaiB